MRYMGTEKILCCKCGVELDVPIYENDDSKKYGYKHCHQCGAVLLSDDEKEVLVSAREGIAAKYGYTQDQVTAYWQGAEDARSKLEIMAKEVLKMAEYVLIERNKIFEKVTELYRYSKGDMHIAYRELLDYILDMSAADVQPLSVVAEHIKNRLYETAFNTDDEKASRVIEDMANRIDFWIDELKDGEQNEND